MWCKRVSLFSTSLNTNNMSIANNLLEEIYAETQDRFKSSSAIRIVPLEGNPPEKYEVIYTITGMHKDSAGTIQPAGTHSVTITIPFGFPHFPPSCTPNSPIFHPDFDPAAICIGDFWDQDKSLSDLIVFIGQLISGENFSTDNAFNEEAASWYLENSSALPFDTLNIDSSSPSEPKTEASATALQEADELQLDVIDDSDLQSNFDPLDSADTTSDLASSGEQQDLSNVPEKEAVDHDLLLLLRKKKRFYALKSHLENIPDSAHFEQREQLEQLVNKELEDAKALYDEAGKSEHKGDAQQALQQYTEVQALVSDYPNIEKDIDRAKQSVVLLGGVLDGNEPKTSPSQTAKTPSVSQSEPQQTRKKNLTLFEDKENTKKLLGALPVAFGIAVVLFTVVIGYLYLSTNSQYKKAEKRYQKCQQAFEKNDFLSTDKTCTEALSIANRIQFFKASNKETLISDINFILESRKLKEGLAGNVEYKGRYIPISSLESIRRFNFYNRAGNKAFANEQWKKASENLSRAVNIAKNNLDIDQEQIPAIELRSNRAAFLYAYDIGVKLVRQKNWTEASKQLDSALKHLTFLDKKTQEEYQKEIGRLHEEATFISLSTQGAALFRIGKWKQAIDAYESAQLKSPNYLEVHPEQEQLIKEKITKANLYLTIKSGKDAFANSNWDQAIAKYNEAIKILNENSEALKQVNSKDNRKKLSRIKLQASIIRDQQETAVFLKKENFNKAISKLNSISNLINSSPFKSEKEFVTILKETGQAIEQAKDKQFIIAKTAYLEKNYRDIFITNNSLLRAEDLKEPKIEFVKKINNNLLFKMQCLEKGGGRPVRLVLDYLYNPTKDSWMFYTP